MSHSDVVKLAQNVSNNLELGIARALENVIPDSESDLIHSEDKSLDSVYFAGYLWKRSLICDTSSKWVRRWFALKNEDYLYRYKTQKVRTKIINS